MNQETAGIVLAVLSTVMYTIGIVTEKRATRRLPELHARQAVQMVTTLFGDSYWLLGFALLVCGLLTQILALSLAPISIVQPLSVSGIVLLLILSHFFLNDRLGKEEYLGISAILLALILLGFSVDRHDDVISGTTSLARVFEAGLPAVAVGLCLFVVADRIKGTGVRSAHLKAPLFGMASGLMYGVAALGTNEVSTIVKRDGLVNSVPHDLTSPGLYLMIGASVLGFLIFQTALQRTTASVYVPVNNVTGSGYFIVVGTVLFHEHLPGALAPLMLRNGAFVLTVVGLFTLAMSKKDDISPELHEPLEANAPEELGRPSAPAGPVPQPQPAAIPMPDAALSSDTTDRLPGTST